MRGKQETVLNRTRAKPYPSAAVRYTSKPGTRALVSGGLHSSPARSGHWIAILEQFANRDAANCAAGLANKPNGRRSFPLTAERTSAGAPFWYIHDRGISADALLSVRIHADHFRPGSFCQAWRSGLCCHGRPTSFAVLDIPKEFSRHRRAGSVCCTSIDDDWIDFLSFQSHFVDGTRAFTPFFVSFTYNICTRYESTKHV